MADKRKPRPCPHGRGRMIVIQIESALTSFKTWVAFVDDVDPTAAAHNSAAFFTQFGRLQRVSNLHNPILGYIILCCPPDLPGDVSGRNIRSWPGAVNGQTTILPPDFE